MRLGDTIILPCMTQDLGKQYILMYTLLFTTSQIPIFCQSQEEHMEKYKKNQFDLSQSNKIEFVFISEQRKEAQNVEKFEE